MIYVDVKGLIAQKSAREGRKITYLDVEKATGIRKITLCRIATIHDYNITRKDIERLCRYFNVNPDRLLKLEPPIK